jgi:putative ABC transport system permease protein
MSWWSRVVNGLRSARLDDELDEEQRFHIDERAGELEARGLSREMARAQAARQFGNRLRLRESSRDVKLATRVESLFRDIRFGARLLRKDAVVSLAAIVSLGLAIGACTAAFSLIDALILRELPVRDPHSLVYLDRTDQKDEPRFSALCSYPFLERVRQAASSYLEVFSMSQQSLRQALLPDAGGVEEKVLTQFVSGNAFNALGIRAHVGRLLLPSDDARAGSHPVAVISHGFWTRRLGSNPAAIGQWLQVEQKEYQIVGVAQAGFTGAEPGTLTDVWLPNMMFQGDALLNPQWQWLQIWGRLQPGVTAETVRPIITTALTTFETDVFEAEFVGGRRKPSQRPSIDLVDASTGLSNIRREFQRPLLALAGIVGIVLLIACSNVANLLLARGAARRREMALRASIGAGRGRLLQQVLVESSLLTGAATISGVVCAVVTTPFIVSMLTTNENPVYLDVRLDWRVLAFVAVIASITTILFGLAPALRASSAMPGEAMMLGDRSQTAGAGVARSLIAVQIGFSLMILFVAALLLRSFDRLLAVNVGFAPQRLVLLSVEARDRFERPQAGAINRQLLVRVRALPGVESASASGWAFFRGWSWGNSVTVPGTGSAQSYRLAVSAGFFKTMGTRVLDGREFRADEREATEPMPVIVNQSFVRRYLSGQRTVGQRLETTRSGRTLVYEIVGVVEDTRDGSVRGTMNPYLFSPLDDAGVAIEVRTSMDQRTLADYVRKELALVHPSLRLVDVTLQSSLVGNTLLRERLLAVLSGFFAALGLALAAVGLYGVLSYAVVRRTREIGIRLTLGAQPAAVVRFVLGRVALAMIVGIVAGLAGGVYFARFVEALLFEIEIRSVTSLVLPVLGLVVVALIAAWFPARRATRVDPVEALRMD